MTAATKLKSISLFTGIGGLDYGFEAAGFYTAVALELDPVACGVLRENRSWPVIEGDIAAVSSRYILRTAGLKKREADILLGGPPCQPFSKSGYWASGDARRLNDPRASTLKEYLRVLRDTLPQAFLLENVLGLGYFGKSEGLDFVRRELAAINEDTGANYSMQVEALNAAQFGVPQLRERIFIVGARDGRPFRFPSPTHAPRGGAGNSKDVEPYLTAWDAIGDLPADTNDPELIVTGKWADLLPSIPEGGNYLWHTARGGGEELFGWRTRYWNFLLKLAKDQPSWTIQAQPGPATGPFHWRNRKLSASEICRLQTLPENLTYDLTWSGIQRLVGNAVPSALAEALAREIRHQFFGQRINQKPLTLIPKRSLGVPRPEVTLPVAQKYRFLIGSHAEHPGTGKGAGALRRPRRVA